MDLQSLYVMWDLLKQSPLDENRCIKTGFMQFSAGTNVKAVYRWFEQQNPEFDLAEVLRGIRRSYDSFVIVSVEEFSSWARTVVHGTRFDRAIALDLARVVAMEIKASVEADLQRDSPNDFSPLHLRSIENGYAIMATQSLTFARIQVHKSPTSTVVGTGVSVDSTQPETLAA